jgi:hypothetical protein
MLFFTHASNWLLGDKNFLEIYKESSGKFELERLSGCGCGSAVTES